MKFIAIYFITLILFLLSFKDANASQLNDDNNILEYYGADHSEFEIVINGYILIEQSTAPTKALVDPQIRSQMRYMLGLMRSRENQAAALYPKWSYNITETKKNAGNSYIVKYILKSKGVFKKGTSQYTFTLPINPKKIFAQAQGKCNVAETEESNFWYHWEPLKQDCPLKENVDYFNYNTTLTPIINTTTTYPEYAKLVDGSKTIKMTMFFGFEKYGFQNWNPNGGEDWGIKGFNQQKDFLIGLGFTETIWNQQQIETLYKAKDKYIPYISEFNLKGGTANIRIRLVLSDTGFSHNSTAFHTILKEALAKESVVVYNGHSGIGHNLDLSAIEKQRNFKFVFNPAYQILFLGSCVPYAYYTDMFFSRKKSSHDLNGTLNLDIFSYGKESVFGNEEDHALTRALTYFANTGDKKSFQEIINSSPNYFFGINGDEDNPTIK